MADNSKSWVEVLLFPLVITVIGIFGTHFVTNTQLESAKNLAEANQSNENKRAHSQEQLKLLEIFSDQFKSEDPIKRKMAVHFLGALEPELAEKLAQAVADTDPAPEVREIAGAVVTAAVQQGNSFAVVGSYQNLQQAQDALNGIRDKLTQANLLYVPEVYLSENGYYALTLGGNLTSKEANQRVQRAKSVVADAYVRTSDRWGPNLLK